MITHSCAYDVACLYPVVFDPQGPLRFIEQKRERGLGHISLSWDDSEHELVGGALCGNTNGAPCPQIGTIRHLGHKFSPDETGAKPMTVTANADLVGLVGGFGWLLELHQGAPKSLRIDDVEVLPDTPLLLSIPYPKGTSVNVIVGSAHWCRDNDQYTCSMELTRVDSVLEVRNGLGNIYHVDDNGVLTLRILQGPRDFVGRPEWFLPNYEDPGKNGEGYAFTRFERDGVLLPLFERGRYYQIDADCEADGAYCNEAPGPYDPDVCPVGMIQESFDKCCKRNGAGMECYFADGTTSIL